MSQLPLPSHADISPTNGLDLDEQYALKQFEGLTWQAITPLLQDNFIEYRESLLFMGKKAFLYYLQAVEAFVIKTDISNCPSALYHCSNDVYNLLCIRANVPAEGSRFYFKHYHVPAEELLKHPSVIRLKDFFITGLTHLLNNYSELICADYTLPAPAKIKKHLKKWQEL